MSFELINNKDKRYPPELNIPLKAIYEANLGEIIEKFYNKIIELENRIKDLESKL